MFETENNCEKCQKPMTMYYREYCPRCEVPKPKDEKIYNLLEWLTRLEATDKTFDKDRRRDFWHKFCDYNSFLNDTFIRIHRPDEVEDDYDIILNTIFDQAGIEESAIFEISW